MSDESTKSFAVVDIKTPGSQLVGDRYRGDAGSGLPNEIYSIHPALSGGVVQVRNQIAVAVDNFTETLGAGFAELNRVHPKGVLISGMLSELNERERDSFNYFRQGLFSMTVITYDEVLHRLKLLFDQGSTKVVDTAEPQDEPPDDIPW